jgi:cellulose synthase/poly-beta-1,6-N-acetylglucosamine synthase-like glycosyltransferase
MIVLEILFWASVGLIAYAHVGYPVVLAALLAIRGQGSSRHPRTRKQGREHSGDDERGLVGAEEMPAISLEMPALSLEMPTVSLVIAAYDEEDVIAAKVANALALEYPRDRLQVIVASDGSGDATVERAREAGADLVLDLPRGGKVTAQNAAAESAHGEILAFSDANSSWAPEALRRLVEPFADPAVGHVCGQVRFTDPGGGNLEGAYWRYEMAVREMESRLAGVTAGNGAIYAVRAEAYLPLSPSGSHDLSFPFSLAKRGRRSLYAAAARAEERMVPTLEGELARKRRMMVGIWDIVVGEGMLRPRGYPPLYAFELASHRLLRYATPFLHLVALAANVALLGHGWVYTATLIFQLALIAAGLLGRVFPLAPFRIARYYLMTTASIALGLWDRARRGAPGTWEKAEGTR